MQQVILTAIAVILAYVLGSIPVAVIIARWAGSRDPRRTGTRNAGATNVALQAGWKAGAAVFVLDLAKGLVAVWLGATLAGAVGAQLAALGAILGQIHPVFTRFEGGKGMAATAGSYLALAPTTLLLGLLIWVLLATVIVRRFILASIGAVLIVAIAIMTVGPHGMKVFAVGALCLVLWSHRHDLRSWRQMPTARMSLRDNPRT